MVWTMLRAGIATGPGSASRSERPNNPIAAAAIAPSTPISPHDQQQDVGRGLHKRFGSKIRTAFQEPVVVDCDPERAEDEDYVRAKYEEVCASIQTGMDALARRRRLPLFG